jgi:alcohol dehydrogenase
MMLPHVIRFNGQQCGDWYFELLECTAGGNGFPAPQSGYGGLADFVGDLASRAGLAARLRELDIPQDRFESLATDAAKQWTAGYNPRAVGVEDLVGLYRAAY